MPWEIDFYETENGVKCVESYLDSIKDKKLKAKIVRDIGLLREFGTDLREPYTDYIKDGIWELRTKQSNNIARTFYFTVSGKKIILLHGFVKKTNKTPKREIECAINNKNDYLRRHS